MRVGVGVDAHALVEGVPLVLGGVAIEHERGLAGHSDGDVISHALIDAILGAAGLGVGCAPCAEPHPRDLVGARPGHPGVALLRRGTRSSAIAISFHHLLRGGCWAAMGNRPTQARMTNLYSKLGAPESEDRRRGTT